VIDLDELYFEWLLTQIEPDGVKEGLAYLCGLLHDCEFHRRVGNDINRAIDGANLRKTFFEQFAQAEFNPNDVNALLERECTWLEMLIALATSLDFLYEGGVDGRLIEIVTNMGIGPLAIYDPRRSKARYEYDRHVVAITTRDIDHNLFDRNGHGGMFPLRTRGHPDQRGVEIWDQCAAYFNERLKGAMWTSIN
jgi:hypothetical protein